MTYAVELPPGGPADWSAWSRDLAARIRSLGDGEGVTVTVSEFPGRTSCARHGSSGSSRPATRTWLPGSACDATRTTPSASLIGSEEFGGEFFFSPDEESRLAEIGWREPGPISMEERVWNRWYPDDVSETAYLGKDDALAAADLVTRTLRDVIYAAEN